MERSQPLKGRPVGYEFKGISGSEGISAAEKFQEAIVLFVGAERDAGATSEEILKFCDKGQTERTTLSLKAHSAGRERLEFEAAASAMRQLYGDDGWEILARPYFEDALNAYDEAQKTISSSEEKEDAAA